MQGTARQPQVHDASHVSAREARLIRRWSVLPVENSVRWCVGTVPSKESFMWQAKFDLPDVKRDRLLALIETIDAGLASGDATVRSAFTELVEILSIGEATSSQVCPGCKRESRTGASRCAYCWKSLAG